MPVDLWTYFYHLTHHRNLPSVFEHGILSGTIAHQRGLTAVDIANLDVQRWRSYREPVYDRPIHDYAPLYINPKNPMLFARREIQHEIVILKVSPEVLQHHQHIYSDGNAASANTRFSADRKIVEASNKALLATQWADEPDGKRRRCAEVLVYPTVEPRFIVAAICSNQELAKAAQTYCPVPIVVDSAVFY